MKFASFAVCAALWIAPLATAQKLELKFDALAAKASSKTELDVDGTLLRLISRMAKESDLSGVLGGVQGVHIRNYGFSKDGVYSQKDLEPLRNQVAAQSRWARLLNVKEDEGTTEIYIAAQGEKVNGCLIVSAGLRELSVVYLEGTLSLAQVKRLVDEDARHELGALFENR
jgi:hypothetical protein